MAVTILLIIQLIVMMGLLWIAIKEAVKGDLCITVLFGGLFLVNLCSMLRRF